MENEGEIRKDKKDEELRRKQKDQQKKYQSPADTKDAKQMKQDEGGEISRAKSYETKTDD